MRAKSTGDTARSGSPGWDFWRRLRRPAAASDETERWLVLAGFADGRLGAKDRERIARLLGREPDASADVSAAWALGGIATLPASQGVIARATALIDSQTPAKELGEGVLTAAFPLPQPVPQPVPRLWRGAAGWSSLAAAVTLAGWLGFGLGSGMLLIDPYGRVFEDAAAGGSADPAPALVRDFNEGWQT